MTDTTESPFALTPGTVQQGANACGPSAPVGSRTPLLVWEHPYYPTYVFAESDLEVELRANGHGPRSKVLGVSENFDVVIGERCVPRAVRRYPQPVRAPRPARQQPRVIVSVNGVAVAESHRPVVLFETGLVPRFYLPQTDVRTDLLVPSDTTSHCHVLSGSGGAMTSAVMLAAPRLPRRRSGGASRLPR